MNWKRYKFLIISAAISLLASAVLIFLILRTGAQTTDLRNDVTRLKSSQTQLAAMTPFPSRESYEFLQNKYESLSGRRAEIKELILESQISPMEMSRSLFGDFVRTQFVPPLIAGAAAATAGGEQGVILRDPSFGLQQYLDGVLPEPQEIPSLMVRLESMRHLTLLMFGSGISELVRIEPGRTDDARRTPARTRTGTTAAGGVFGAAQPSPAARAETASPVPSSRRSEMFDEVTFTVSVNVYEDKLWGFLNALASDGNQMVLRNLSITNANQQLWPAYLRPDPRMGTPTGRAQTAARADRRPANPLLAALMNQADGQVAGETAPAVRPGLRERRELTVGGELLNVSFDVTFYRLKPVAQGS
jgi:hypothetical protein